MDKPKVYSMTFAKIYNALVAKAERKERNRAEVNEVIFWLTGYDEDSLARQLNDEVDLETFFTQAPQFNSNAYLITGRVCGIKVEEIEDELMQRIRYLDKLVDELAKGWPMEKILRSE